MGILKEYIKNGVIQIGTDLKEVDTPKFRIREIRIDIDNESLDVAVMHEVMQGSVMQPHERSFDKAFADLPSAVRQTGLAFFQAIEAEMLARAEYNGATEV